MRFAVYSAPVAHLLSFLVFTSLSGWQIRIVSQRYISRLSSLQGQAYRFKPKSPHSVFNWGRILSVKPCRKSRDTLQSNPKVV